jgi:hypothetical protein
MSIFEPSRGLTQPSSSNRNEAESSSAAIPWRDATPGSSGAGPSMSSSVRVVPPRSRTGSP